jgi:ABC-type bacteriocin/lantibiotic exporter with double-glycine peptidase domain
MIFSRIYGLLNNLQRKQLVSNIVYVLLLGIFDILSLAFLLSFLRYIFLNSDGKNQLFGRLQTVSGITDPVTFAVYTGLLLLLLFIIKNYISYRLYQRHTRFVYGIATFFSGMLMKRYFHLDYQAYTAGHSGQHSREISGVPIEFAHYLLLGFITLVSEGLIMLLLVLGLMAYRPDVFFLLIIVLLPCVMLSFYLNRKRAAAVRKNIQQASPLSMKYLLESLNSFIETKMHGREKFFVDRYAEKQKTLNSQIADMLAVQFIPHRLLEVFAVAGVIIILLVRLAGNAFDPETFVILSVFLAAAYKALPSLNKIITAIGQMRTFAFTLDVLKGTADKDISEKEDQPDLHIDFKEGIKLENISFTYEGRTDPTLKDLSLLLPKGEITGLTGSSGNGKTTLVKVLLLFLKPSGGRILADNKEILQEDASAWRKGVAYVKQMPFIMDGSLAENITLGESRELADKSRLEASVTSSGLGSFISSLPAGLDTMITEGGRNLSGGQRQRLALARALYQQCPLIILDESFNQLEGEMVEELGKTLLQLAGEGETILLVSHQPQVLKHCSAVYKLSQGQLIAD